MSQRWIITTFRGAEKIGERFASGSLSESEIATMLQRLVARHLDEDEILAASQRKGTRFRRSDFDIHQDKSGKLLSTNGTDYHYAARFADD